MKSLSLITSLYCLLFSIGQKKKRKKRKKGKSGKLSNVTFAEIDPDSDL